MSIATLDDIIAKVRRLTGSGNNLKLTDSAIIDYINSFYLYDFPAKFRSLKLQDTYTFNTVQNQDVYAFDFNNFTTVESPCYIADRLVPLYQSPYPFYGLFFNWQQFETLGQGDGTAGAYSFTTQNTVIVRSVNTDPTSTSYPIGRVQNILITSNTASGTENVTDNGNGTLIDPTTGANRGTINYQTGVISVTFANAIPSGNDIIIRYNPVTPNIPQAILFYQNQFTLRPVPDKGYTVTLVTYRTPLQALLGTTDPNNPTGSGIPELLEWWETLATGAAKKIFEDRQDLDGIAMMDKMLFERYDHNETRTYAQLGKRRIATIYSDQLDGYGAGYMFNNQSF